MAILNHTNLAVSDVPELTRFFVTTFGFEVVEQRGRGKFAVLRGEDDFALILMHDKNVYDATYPALFHIGFLVDSTDEVLRLHQSIVNAGFETPDPAILIRGGGKTFGFYCKAPGGVLVEVSTPAIELEPALAS
jgi:catechol 2,3-dioxygenase-like lactoylglutathione lyase family enzyme